MQVSAKARDNGTRFRRGRFIKTEHLDGECSWPPCKGDYSGADGRFKLGLRALGARQKLNDPRDIARGKLYRMIDKIVAFENG